MHPGEFKVLETNDNSYTYEFPPIGKARIAMPTYIAFQNARDFKHPELAGICRNAFEDGIEPPLLTSDFIANGLKNIPYPKTFKEKARHFLKYLYTHGGDDYYEFYFQSNKDYPIAFVTNEQEFNKIIEHLEEKHFLKFNPIRMAGHRVDYWETTLTEFGIEEVEKELPKIPMHGLVVQEITTGDKAIDLKINHTKRLFFEQPQTVNNMRSACETLSYILEPYREDCVSLFGKKDIDTFFNMVNNFEIRHNKESTMKIQHPEQLEWVFYSLLNTINTYTKLKFKYQ